MGVALGAYVLEHNRPFEQIEHLTLAQTHAALATTTPTLDEIDSDIPTEEAAIEAISSAGETDGWGRIQE